jgi:ferrous-iron efflux pump FieF
MTNIASGIGVFIVLIIKNSFIDPTVASVFAIYIIYRAFALIKNSLNELMDHDISESIKEKIYSAIKVVDARIVDIHRFRGRKSGHKYFLDFHVTLPQQLSFDEVHVIIENIENFISLEFDADVIVHADPDEVRS